MEGLGGGREVMRENEEGRRDNEWCGMVWDWERIVKTLKSGEEVGREGLESRWDNERRGE